MPWPPAQPGCLLQLWITLGAAAQEWSCAAWLGSTLKAASRSLHPSGMLRQKGVPSSALCYDPWGKLDSVPKWLSLSFGLHLPTLDEVMGWTSEEPSRTGQGQRRGPGSIIGASFSRPGEKARQWAPPLPTPPGQETSNWKGGYTSPHPIHTTCFRKQKGKHPFNPSAERVSHKTWITGAGDGMCWWTIWWTAIKFR